MFSRIRFPTFKAAPTKSKTSGGSERKRGLILIQIDGLSRPQFERARAGNRVPFVDSILSTGHRLLSHYSGLPSSTPAVQGEIFYGVRCAVPSFGFCESQQSEMTSMLNPETVALIEKHLSSRGRPLLQGGTAYSNIYNGGACKSEFCAAAKVQNENSFGWNGPLGLKLGLVPRLIFFGVIEILLSLYDLVRGASGGRKNFLKELSFVPSRILICLMLRELITAAAMSDVFKGVPVIHCNFLGYDEQSHRRGPDSAFAHWTLKGIDASIRRIWAAACAQGFRDYQIVIYSDHGQERTRSYEVVTGQPVHKTVDSILRTHGFSNFWTLGLQETLQLKGMGFLDPQRWKKLINAASGGSKPCVRVVAIGPIAHIYFPFPVDSTVIEEIASDLVDTGKVPLVLVRGASQETARAWNSEGRHELPEHLHRVLSENHPFAHHIGADLLALVHHEFSGHLILSGMDRNGASLSFPVENGAHAGPGPNETHGFIAMPRQIVTPAGKVVLRPTQLREAILDFLDEAETRVFSSVMEPQLETTAAGE